ncbi:hypothetical protein [Coraliomargarita parva]|uniref:hypothetical protein n=1 Tax=Coraliomargarita parva TaxID=3014050 RepID=UPI0022B5D039|nr:hypothetical protein [Coraliomargarita parva]
MDSSLYIDLPKTHYQPEETLRGEILWAQDEAPESIHLSLGWWTEGRGSKDAKIETELEWPSTDTAGQQSFEITLPKTPYSFNGQLITLKWALELRTRKGGHSHSVEISIAPGDAPVDLPLIEDESPRKSIFRFGRR